MELMLTGDHMSGIEAAESGFANRAFPSTELEDRTLDIAERVARTPTDLQQINKRAVHRQMDAMGIRAGIRAGTEMQELATHTATTRAHVAELRENLNAALSKRDREFGDYRTAGGDGPAGADEGAASR
jgi:enoyl-CoA hydratase